MENQSKQLECSKHHNVYQYICLDEQCKQNFLLCQTCYSSNIHKHSKTTIEKIKQVRKKLIQKWDNADSAEKCRSYSKKIRDFYERMRKDLTELINQDQKTVEVLLQKLSYHHLPVEANSQAYIEFKKEEYARLDKASILKLIEEAQNGEPNKDLQQQKEVMNMLDVQLAKQKDKVMTLKYILLSTKIQTELLSPKIQQNSKICQYDEFSKVYALFNSKGLVIRSATMIYRGSQSNFTPKKFYNACNNQLNCLALVKVQNGRKAGGFSTLPMVYHDEEIDFPEDQIKYEEDRTKRSFVFSLTNLASYDVKNSHKAIGYKKNAIGPIFGPDLNISNKSVQSSLGNSYQSPQGVDIDSLQAKVYLLGAGKIDLEEMEIWQLSF